MINDLALFFAPDGYVLSKQEINGRQAVGNSFLRALVADDEISSLSCYTPSRKNADIFNKFIASLSPSTATNWIEANDIEGLKSTGLLYFPDPIIKWAATIRMRGSVDAYSICGITHTVASHAIMDTIAELPISAVMPWDAVICTSESVLKTVNTVIESQREYLHWRFNDIEMPEMCQFPVIPLGVHAKEFKFSENQRKSAREKLGISKDEIVILYLGRLSQYTKANPAAMYEAIEKVAKQVKKKVVLVECGWAPEDINQEMDKARAHFCSSYRWLRVDGRRQDLKSLCLRSADIFTSIPDNVQETFGITPVEAMACGLPVVISDWDGYKELLDDGVEGFKIPTIMPADTERHALNYDAGGAYERYCASVAQTTAIDMKSYVAALKNLVNSSTLRKKMGQNGIQRVAKFYDWPIVLKQYKSLWAELAEIRQSLGEKYTLNAPGCPPGRQSPSKLFSSYPTKFLDDDSIISVVPEGAIERYHQLKDLAVINIGRDPMPSDDLVERIVSAAENNTKISVLKKKLNLSDFQIQRAVGILLKLDIVKTDF